jgi:hypothetical protein
MGTERYQKLIKSIGVRLGVSILFSPIIIFISGVFTPSTAYATDSGEEVDDSQIATEPIEAASEEVIQQETSPETTQASIDEVSTAVATAESDIQSVEQELQETKNLEQTIESTANTAEAIQSAEEAVSSASEVVDSASSAISEATTAVEEWSAAQEQVAAQEVVVSSNETTLEEAETALSEATPDNPEKTTVTEDLEDLDTADSDIEISVGGSTVSSTNQSGVSLRDLPNDDYIKDQGVVLDMQNSTQDVVIDFTTAEQEVKEVGFTVWALNGNTTAEVVEDQADGTQTTVSHIISDTVANNYSNGYARTETYTTSEGVSIDKVVISATKDWFTIDNIFWVFYDYVIDPIFQQNFDNATVELQSSQETLATYVSNEREKGLAALNAADSVFSFSTSISEAVESAQTESMNAASVVAQEVVAQTPPPPAPAPKPEPIKIELPEPSLLPTVVQPAEIQLLPEPLPQPTPEPVQVVQAPVQQIVSPEPTPEDVLDEVLSNPNSSVEERVDAIIATIVVGEAVDITILVESGISFDDLPPETPIEMRLDENGNSVVIDARTASSLAVLESPQQFIEEVFTDPAAALEALSNIGMDMSEEEREESQDIVVASVVVANVANLASNAAAAGGSVAAYRRKP